jgi:tetratricopeptide (TPR) repeat protein
MKRRNIIPAISILMLFALFMSSCQSPEVTSAKVYFQQNNIEAAKEQLMIALEKEPQNPEVPFLLAVQVYMAQKDWLKAKEYLDKVTAIDPDYVYPTGRTSVADQLDHIWGEIHTQGANLFNEALKSVLPIEKDSLLKKAAEKFQLALEINDQKIDSYNALIKCYYMNDDTVNLLQQAEEFLEKGLYDEEIVLYYAQSLFHTGEQEKAVEILNSTLAQNPEALKLQELRIQFLAQLERLDEAKEIADQLSRDYPTDVNIMYLLAQIYYKLGDYESAQYQFKKVLIENPDDIEVLANIGNAAFQAGDWLSAEDYARRMIDKDSEYAFGYTLLWKALYNQGKVDEAEEYRQIEKSLR